MKIRYGLILVVLMLSACGSITGSKEKKMVMSFQASSEIMEASARSIKSMCNVGLMEEADCERYQKIYAKARTEWTKAKSYLTEALLSNDESAQRDYESTMLIVNIIAKELQAALLKYTEEPE